MFWKVFSSLVSYKFVFIMFWKVFSCLFYCNLSLSCLERFFLSLFYCNLSLSCFERFFIFVILYVFFILWHRSMWAGAKWVPPLSFEDQWGSYRPSADPEQALSWSADRAKRGSDGEQELSTWNQAGRCLFNDCISWSIV